MFFIGAGCKLMQDAGLKGVWSTVYKENPLPKMLKGKADSPCLRLEIYSTVWMMNNSLRILTLKSIVIYKVFS